MQDKFLFCAACGTKNVSLYPLRYKRQYQRISSYLTLPVFKLGSPYLKHSSTVSLPFHDTRTTAWLDPSHTQLTNNTVTRREIRLYCIWKHVTHSSPFSYPHEWISLLHWCLLLCLSHTATHGNKCIPASHEPARPFWMIRKGGYLENWCLLIHCLRNAHISECYHLFCSIWSSWKNSSAHRREKMQDTVHSKDPVCHLHDALGCELLCWSCICHREHLWGFVCTAPQLFIPSVPERGRKHQHSKCCIHVIYHRGVEDWCLSSMVERQDQHLLKQRHTGGLQHSSWFLPPLLYWRALFCSGLS